MILDVVDLLESKGCICLLLFFLFVSFDLLMILHCFKGKVYAFKTVFESITGFCYFYSSFTLECHTDSMHFLCVCMQLNSKSLSSSIRFL